MKAFEEYFNNTNDSICSECAGGFIPARDVWKAALEWCRYNAADGYGRDIINEELEPIKPSEKEV